MGKQCRALPNSPASAGRLVLRVYWPAPRRWRWPIRIPRPTRATHGSKRWRPRFNSSRPITSDCKPKTTNCSPRPRSWKSEITALRVAHPTQAQASQAQSHPPMTYASEAREPASKAKPDDGSLTWHGITLYGTFDVGVGWVSHGLPENGYNYEGESWSTGTATNPSSSSRLTTSPQTGLGIRGKEDFAPGWFGVFNASTGINPQSGQLANMAAHQHQATTACRGRAIRSPATARAPAALQRRALRRHVASDMFGTLTFGRQRALGTDAMLHYDPAGGAYAFSFIGYNGLMAGGGDTQDTRWDERPEVSPHLGPVHFGAMYKFADGSGGCYSASAGWTAATCTPEAAAQHRPMASISAAATAVSQPTSSSSTSTRRSAWSIRCWGPRACRRPINRRPTASIPNPINGANLIATDQHRIRHRHRQHGCHGRGQIRLETVQVLRRLRVHPLRTTRPIRSASAPQPRAAIC